MRGGDHVLGVDFEAFVAAPEDGALAGGAIDDDVGGLIGAALSDHDVVKLDAGAFEAIELDAAAEVDADGADVLWSHVCIRLRQVSREACGKLLLFSPGDCDEEVKTHLRLLLP